MTITSASSAVQAIFALHVTTAGSSLILLVAAVGLLGLQFKKGAGKPRFFNRWTQRETTGHGPLGTHLFLWFGLFNLMIAYATQAAIVALQTEISSPFYITSAYAYPSYEMATGFNESRQYAKIISILSFLYQCANILLNTCIVGAIWIHANHIHNNGTGIREPGLLSWAYNLFWMIAILGLGFASWAVGLARRGSDNTALAYPTLIGTDYTIRTIYVTYVCVIIAASTSVTLESFLCWIGVKKNGIVGNAAKPALTRFVLMMTPVVWLRNMFSVAQIVIIYYNENNWSQTVNQALAFVFIIFGELSNLAIFAILLLGAWSLGRKNTTADAITKTNRDSANDYGTPVA